MAMPAVSGMLRTMAASPRVHLANPKKNAEEISALLDLADANGVQLCVFPELCLTGATCGDLFLHDTLLFGARDALEQLFYRQHKTVFVVGLPMAIEGRVYNCAAVVTQRDVIIVPKVALSPDQQRVFAPGAGISGGTCAPDLPCNPSVNCHPVVDLYEYRLGVTFGADTDGTKLLTASGADIVADMCALSAQIGAHGALSRRLLAASEEAVCAVVHANAGYGESTTDFVFSGNTGVYEAGDLLGEGDRFARGASYVIADVDVERLRFIRRRTPALYAPGVCDKDRPKREYVTDEPQDLPRFPRGALLRPMEPLPFVPKDEKALHEALLIMTQGLLTRMDCIHAKSVVIGVSGGLDSTLTLLAAAFAFDRAGLDRKDIIGITMPGLGTGKRTKGNADLLMERIGCTALEIPIGPAVAQHFADIGQSPDVHDICYENSQARERTQIVMDYANKVGALALGTGDLSELALGWCTYNGDHMSMYNMSATLTKTLIRPLTAYCAGLLGEGVLSVAQDIIDTPVSPELIPSKEGELSQRTEDKLGSYEINDFFLFHMMDGGAAPAKLYALACQAFEGKYAPEMILRTLRTFVWHFFSQQFKRSALPDGPKVGPVSLSPRGGLSMPSDAQAQLWLDEVSALSE